MAVTIQDTQTKYKLYPQVLTALAVSLGAFCLGIGQTWALSWDTGPCAEYDNYWNCPDEFQTQIQWTIALFDLGAIVSCIFAGALMDAIGRKWTMIVVTIPTCIGWTFLVLVEEEVVDSIDWVYAGRFLIGFGTGVFTLTAPFYIFEISDPKYRGALEGISSLMIIVGALVTIGLSKLVSNDILTIICLFIPIVVCCILILIPESPYYLLKTKGTIAAKKAVQLLRGSNTDISYHFDLLQAELESSLEIEKKFGMNIVGSLKIALKSWRNGITVLGIMFFHAYCGFSAVTNHLSDMINASGISLSPDMLDIAMKLLLVVGYSVTLSIVDKVGRRPLLMVSAVLMAFGLLGIGAYFDLEENREVDCSQMNANNNSTDCEDREGIDNDIVDSLFWLPLAFLAIYCLAFATGFGPLPYVVNGELFPMESKPILASLTSSFDWFCIFLLDKFQYAATSKVETAIIFYVYSGVCLVGTFYVYFFIPETKLKLPSDIRNYWKNRTIAVAKRKRKSVGGD